jgi:pimeloyl-ACP methyl ester carboxylesterase
MTISFDDRISYEVSGDGPLVVCVPGMADLRSTFRFVAPALVAAGYRIAIIDLRGHGDSATDFDRYDNVGNAADVAALIGHLGGPAVIVGNSMGAAVATVVAAEHPDLVAGLVLIGPFVRNGKASGLLRAVMRIATSPRLVGFTWKAYLPSLYRGTKPADLPAYLAAVSAGLKGHEKAISATLQTSHDVAEAALPRVHTEVLVIMGELDPEFASPAGEAEWIAAQLGGEVLMVPDAAHYPQSQRPDVVAPAVTEFLQRVTRNA